MFPTEAHMNMGGSIHGGAVMSFIDMAMFAGGRCAGMARGPLRDARYDDAFPRARPGRAPLDAHVELVKQTRSHVFLQGVVRQDGEACYSFTGTLKRIRDKNAPA